MNKNKIALSLTAVTMLGLAVSLLITNKNFIFSKALGEKNYSLSFFKNNIDPEFVDDMDAYISTTVNTSDDGFDVYTSIYADISYGYLLDDYMFKIDSKLYTDSGYYSSGSIYLEFSLNNKVLSFESIVFNGTFKFAKKSYTETSLTYDASDMTITPKTGYTNYSLYINDIQTAYLSNFSINYIC